MIINIKSTLPLDIDTKEVMKECRIEDGDSDYIVRSKIASYFKEGLNLEDGVQSNIEEIIDLIADDALSNMKYYITIGVNEDDNI